jgi:peptidyl-prolyl cis-trans isomerase B (cyclophilin B)
MKSSIFITTILTLLLSLQTGNAMDGITKKECFMSQTDRPKYTITVTQGGKELGVMEIELFPDIAPKHCENFDSLVATGFYDGTAFHRVIPGFMIQGGDPNSKTKPSTQWGFGDPSQKKVPAEFSKTPHTRGILSAARSQDINSASSQFFICHADAPHLDGQYTVYGQLLKGFEVLDVIAETPCEKGNLPAEKVEMKITKVN